MRASPTSIRWASGTSCGDASDSSCDNPDTCDGVGNCQINNELDGTSCADGLFCNGAETCDAALGCQIGDAPLVDDGIPCTEDVCDESVDEVRHDPRDGLCDDVDNCPNDLNAAQHDGEGQEMDGEQSREGGECLRSGSR